MTRDDWLTLGPDGWHPLIAELDARLRTRWPDYTITQVKEKYGTLRFYADPGVEAPDFPDDEDGDAAHERWHAAHERWHAANIEPFHALIHQYEARTSQICQRCGRPGRLGVHARWWSTLCTDCAPDGWTAACDHASITDGACDSCGRGRLARLEHSEALLANTHPAGTCLGEWCTIHNRSDHPMRAFPQHWRADRGLMERRCPHGVGHPDPDDARLSGPSGADEAVHGCDGCCAGAYR